MRYAVLANAGLACASICQGRLLRLWFWKAWRLSLTLSRFDPVRRMLQRVCEVQDGYQKSRAFQAWARAVAASHCSLDVHHVWMVAVGPKG